MRAADVVKACEAAATNADRLRIAGQDGAAADELNRCFAALHHVLALSAHLEDIEQVVAGVKRQSGTYAGQCAKRPWIDRDGTGGLEATTWPLHLADAVVADCALFAKTVDLMEFAMQRLAATPPYHDWFSCREHDHFIAPFALATALQARILGALATLPSGHTAAVAESWVPSEPPATATATQLPWAPEDAEAAARAVRARLAGGPAVAMPPAAQRWLALMAQGGTRVPESRYRMARLLLRNGHTSTPALVAPAEASSQDGAALAWLALGDVEPRAWADTELALLRWTLAISHGNKTADEVIARLAARKAHCDRPERPCQPLRLASMPNDATMTVDVCTVGCFSGRRAGYTFVKAPAPALVLHDGPPVPLSAADLIDIDAALTRISGLTEGGCTTSSRYVLAVQRGEQLLATQTMEDATCSNLGAVFGRLDRREEVERAKYLAAHDKPAADTGSAPTKADKAKGPK